MSKHVGIVACSAEGAALRYRTLCTEAATRMGPYGHPEVSMHTHSLALYMNHLARNDWQGIAELMLSSAHKLAQIGAEFVICPDNTIHQVFAQVAADSPIPWLHIAEAVGRAARQEGYRRLALTGTQYLMTGPVYPEALERLGLAIEIPDDTERLEIDRIIFEELVNGICTDRAREYFHRVFERLKKNRGCDAAVLGCTEIPLLIDPAECPLPTLDSTRLLARAALDEALNTD